MTKKNINSVSRRTSTDLMLSKKLKDQFEDLDDIRKKIEYVGPALQNNVICLHMNIKKVKNIALGEEHMLAHCENLNENRD